MDNNQVENDLEIFKSLDVFENPVPPPTSYIELVETRKKPAADILIGLSGDTRKIDMWHMATGIAGEAGEVLSVFMEFQSDVDSINTMRKSPTGNLQSQPPFLKSLFERHADVPAKDFFNTRKDPEEILCTEFHKKAILELGDMEFYLEGFRQCIGYPREAFYPTTRNLREFSMRFPKIGTVDFSPAILVKVSLELLDHVKKVVVYGKDMDLDLVTCTLVDIECALQDLRLLVSTDYIEVVQMNELKLRKRYKEKYSDKQAIERADTIQVTESNFDQLTQEQLDR